MRIDVLFKMTLLLLGKKMTASQLAHYFTLSTRTVYRYLTILDTTGIPITSKCGRNGGITILGSFRLGGLFFTPAERMTLLSLMPFVPTKFMRDNLTRKLNLLQ